MSTRREILRNMGIAATALTSAGVTGIRPALAAWHEPYFDSHCHLISRDLKRYPKVSVEFPTVPGRAPTPPQPPQLPGVVYAAPEVSDVLRWMDQCGVESAAAVQKRGAYGVDNRYVLDTADLLPERFTAVAVLDGEDTATPDRMRGMARDHRLAGVRFSGAAKGGLEWLSSPQVLKSWAVANELELTVDLMAVPPGYAPEPVAAYLALARRFPKCRLVINHLAWPDATRDGFGLNAELRQLNDAGNVFWKFTTINLDMLDEAKVLAADFLRGAVDAFGANRIMWGSDVGNSAGTYAELVARMELALKHLNKDERRAVMRETGLTAYRF